MTWINKYDPVLVDSLVRNYTPLIIDAYAFQEEPPNKKKRLESSINWTGLV